ncbi:MAG: hypothetical protein RIR18_1899 [Pseudomonadota bacterium]|jgi:diguanylate cyclase (GGDEF)-like protein/PAS domain S-box-containing protein
MLRDEILSDSPSIALDYLRISIEGLQQGVMLFDSAGRVLHANPAAEHILGLSFANMQANRQQIGDWKPVREDGSAFPIDQLPLSLALSQGVTSQQVVIGDVTPDGQMVWKSVHAQPIFEQGKVVAAVVSFENITERIAAQKALLREYERFQQAVEAAPAAMLVADAAGAIVLTNPALERLFGYARGELLGQPVEILLPEMLREHHIVLRQQFAAAPTTRQMGSGMDLLGQRKDGSTLSVEVGLGYMQGNDGSLQVVAMVADISERRRLLEMEAINRLLEQKVQERTAELEAINLDLSFLALHDSLTGLHNRRSFTNRLRDEYLRMQRTGERYALVLIDIDHFKRVNDGYGHETGDIVLKHVAAILQESARVTDFVARLGGEEFVVLLPNTDEGARVIAEKMRQAVSESSAPVVGKVTISLGMAVASTEDENEATALNAADQAMYRAKGDGRNCVAEAR